MRKQEQEWFIAERARALALMHLTRRQDLVITESRRDGGLDFIVTIAKPEEEKSLRQFGVFLRGSKAAATEEQLDQALLPTMQSLQRLGQFPYPACLLYFTMDDDEGYFTWVVEPDIENEALRLLSHGEAHCRKLDRAVLDEIVARVDRWYDSFFGRIVVKAS
jgi:hypothetical protein